MLFRATFECRSGEVCLCVCLLPLLSAIEQYCPAVLLLVCWLSCLLLLLHLYWYIPCVCPKDWRNNLLLIKMGLRIPMLIGSAVILSFSLSLSLYRRLPSAVCVYLGASSALSATVSISTHKHTHTHTHTDNYSIRTVSEITERNFECFIGSSSESWISADDTQNGAFRKEEIL